MANIIDRVKSALDPEISAALDTAQAASKLEAELSAKQTQFLAQLAKTEEARDRASLPDDMGGNAKEYERLEREVARLEAERKKNLAAIREAGRRRVEAEVILRKQRAADDIKNAKKFGKQRQEAVEQIVKGIAEAVAGWKKHHELNDRLLIWRPELATIAGGLMLRRDEVRQIIELELSRISSPALLDGKACPVFPGGKAMVLAGNPEKFKPLIEAAQEANSYLARKVEGLSSNPAPAPAPVVAPKPNAPAIDPDDKLLATTQPAGPTVSADQIMATLGRRRMG